MDNINDVINDFYKKKSYLDEYGGSVFMTIIILLIFFSLTSYFHVMNNLDPIKADWVNQRCSPGVIPLAGIINPPTDGRSGFDYTSENFSFCIQNILKQIAAYALVPINSFVNVFMGLFKDMENSVSAMRNIFNNIREDISGITQQIYARILNVMIPIQKMIIGLKDIISKSHGVFTASLYTALGGYLTLKSALGAIFELLVVILIALAALIIILWIVPFTWGVAASMTAVFAAVAVPMALMAVTLNDVFDLHGSKIPGKPHCFSGDSLIKTKNGHVKIKDILPGTILHDNSRVTAVFKLSPENQEMFNLNSVIVSGEHKVLLNNRWIKVKEHPDSIKINDFNERFIYCLNTSNKIITICNLSFSDWDEMKSSEYEELRKVCKDWLPDNKIKPQYLHEYLESGFAGDTLITLNTNEERKINEININDILVNGEKVIGLVKIDASDIVVYEYNYNNKVFKSANNNQIFDLNLGISNLFCHTKTPIKYKTKYLYHILTDKNTLTISDVVFFDYNVAIDGFLKEENKKILTSLLLK